MYNYCGMRKDALADRNIVIVEAEIQHYVLNIGHKFPFNLRTRYKKGKIQNSSHFCSYEVES